jgi:type I restriction enzyme S subunit
VTAKVIKGGRIERPDEFIAEADFDTWMRRGIPERGDIVMTTEAPLGEVAQLDGTKVALAQRVITLRGKPDLLDNTFLKFLLQSSDVQEELRSRGTGTTVVGIRQSELRKVSLTLPPLSEQKAIAGVLGALDDKIELNRRMNSTLESMARALFQSWFVDFDPVRATLDGRPPTGMDKATADLFPDSFDYSSIGVIPNGWTFDAIKNRATNIQYGFTQSATEDPIGPHFLRITDIRGGTIEWSSVPFCKTTENEREKYRVMDGDILVARTGASTGDNIYVVEPPSAVFASYLIRLQFASRGIGRIVGEFTRTSDYASHIAGNIGGSAQPNANAQTLAAASMVFPTEEIADAFYRIVRPFDLQRAANDRESRTLANLRDKLLPKLLSGELIPTRTYVETEGGI